MMKGLLLIVVLLGLIAYSQAWWIRSRSRPSPKSRCTYYRSRLLLSCYSTGDRDVTSCSTRRPRKSSDRVTGGPPPRGDYLIGLMYHHDTYEVDWYNLYPKKKNDTGYYDYYYKNPDTGRSHIALHPGRRSEGCVTVANDTCWSSIQTRVNTGRASSMRVSTSWWRTKTIPFVGRLRVV